MAELHVSKKNIGKLFGDMQNYRFVIPDYQRPYKWSIEKCETLWKDIEDFTENEAKDGADYFLGTIVSFITPEKNQEVIDGQQRITSLLLLLRAFYKKLETMNEDDDVRGLKSRLEPCIWDIDRISRMVSDRSKIRIVSQVATADDNETFHKILENGTANPNAEDNYSKNYTYFKNQCDKYASDNPMQWKNLCVTILEQCIILPIECDRSETALTIFSTLNDRGLPLADSDIFKAQIYKHIKTDDERRDFTTQWKKLTQICKQGKVAIDDVFRYYTHVLRAREGDKSKEVGLRRFYYGEGDYQRLKNPGVMHDIETLANFWRYVNTGIEPGEDEAQLPYSLSIETKKQLHCLSCYPNEYWKYAASVYFLKHHSEETFDFEFGSVLKQLVAFLFLKFIEAPSVNAIKDDIYSICISLELHGKTGVKHVVDEEMVNTRIGHYSSARFSRALLLLDAYLHSSQLSLIPETFDIEHIFPKKWTDANYNGWNWEDAKTNLDRFGNKIIFEKRLNIQAGNNYFNQKKSKYQLSSIACVKELGLYPNPDWLKTDIEAREANFKSRLLDFFKKHLN